MKYLIIDKNPSGVLNIHAEIDGIKLPRIKYIGYTLKNAEALYRQEFNLKNKKIERIYL